MSGPSFNNVDISSNNSIKTNYAGADDVISLNLTVSETINQPYVVFQSGGALITNSPSYSGSGAQWTVSYTVSSSDTDGAVSFILDVSDNGGNTSQITTTTNSTSVTKVGISTLTNTVTTTSGTQLGNDINGEASADTSGWSVSLNDDGTIVAIGAYANNSYTGHVRVYQYSSSDDSWSKLGSDIDGEAADDQSGWSVSLNSDTSSNIIVAIGEHGMTEMDLKVICVYINTASDDSWIKIGSDIDGEDVSDISGYSVSLNSDGTIVAIGAIGTDVNGSNSGHVRVYERDTINWMETVRF